MKVLQIVFCVLACVSVAAVVPVGIFCELIYIAIPIAAAVLFGILMMVAKQKAEPKPPKGPDFMD